MRWILTVLLFSSCMTEQKAVSYFDRNIVEASKYCSAKFPLWERIDTVFTGLDSADYNKAYYDVWQLVDSLLAHPAINVYYDTGTVNYIRTVTQIKVKEILKPCLDSTKTIYVYQEDKGITTALRIDLETANKIAYHHKSMARLRLKIIFSMAALLLISTAYQTRKLWL